MNDRTRLNCRKKMGLALLIFANVGREGPLIGSLVLVKVNPFVNEAEDETESKLKKGKAFKKKKNYV